MGNSDGSFKQTLHHHSLIWRQEAGAEEQSALVEMITHFFFFKSSNFFPGLPEVSSCARMHITLTLLWELLGVSVKRSMRA